MQTCKAKLLKTKRGERTRRETKNQRRIQTHGTKHKTNQQSTQGPKRTKQRGVLCAINPSANQKLWGARAQSECKVASYNRDRDNQNSTSSNKRLSKPEGSMAIAPTASQVTDKDKKENGLPINTTITASPASLTGTKAQAAEPSARNQTMGEHPFESLPIN